MNKQTERLAVIYALCEPDTNEIRYIGRTSRPRSRYIEHLSGPIGDKNPKRIWIDELLAQGKRPIMRILEMVSKSEAEWTEYTYIRHLGKEVYLLNTMNNPRLGTDHRRVTRKCKRGKMIELGLDKETKRKLAELRQRTGLNDSILLALAVGKMYCEEFAQADHL